jgi:hypothetical protein
MDASSPSAGTTDDKPAMMSKLSSSTSYASASSCATVAMYPDTNAQDVSVTDDMERATKLASEVVSGSYTLSNASADKSMPEEARSVTIGLLTLPPSTTSAAARLQRWPSINSGWPSINSGACGENESPRFSSTAAWERRDAWREDSRHIAKAEGGLEFIMAASSRGVSRARPSQSVEIRTKSIACAEVAGSSMAIASEAALPTGDLFP